MDGNKDEALRCVHIAEEAIASGNKERALKFIKIAQRLNHSLSVDQLLAACENLDSGSSPASPVVEKQYDQVGLVDEFEYNQQHNVRQRRRRYGNDLFDDEFDPDEIFRAFFGQGDMFRTSHVYRTRGMGGHQREQRHGGGPNFLVLLQILPFLLIFLLAYLPISEPEYSLFRNYSYQIPKTTEKYGVEFYVKSSAFDVNFPLGSPARANFEDNVIKDYRHMLWRYCHVERQKRHWNKNLPTPHCNKLQNLGLA
ncbi:protein of unknown function DUF1977 [Theobroma cacao]|nr:protein of unknown function DUF1977 [Theobroma cacao]